MSTGHFAYEEVPPPPPSETFLGCIFLGVVIGFLLGHFVAYNSCLY